MAIIHIKNIHNHKIKAGFRNEPLPPYFDGYVDTETGKIIDPNTNINDFLQSVKDEVNTKIGSIDDFIKSSQDALTDQNNQLSKFINEGQAELDSSKASVMDVVSSLTDVVNRNNSLLIEYVFNNSQFAGKKELAVTNGYSIDDYTSKFIKKIKVDLHSAVYETKNWPHDIAKESGWTSVDVVDRSSYSYTQTYDETLTITIDPSDRSVHKVGTIDGVDLYLDASALTSSKIQLSMYAQYGSKVYKDSSARYYEYNWTEHNVYCRYGYEEYVGGGHGNPRTEYKTGYTYKDVPYQNSKSMFFSIKGITLISE